MLKGEEIENVSIFQFQVSKDKINKFRNQSQQIEKRLLRIHKNVGN